MHKQNTKMGIENGFKFSKAKCINFCKLGKLHNDPCFKLDESEFPVIKKLKFLGVIFDRKLTFIPHLKY